MNNSLTNRQIAFVILGVTIGYGSINLPKRFAETAGTGSWVSLLLSTGIVIFFTYLFTYINLKNKEETIYEYGTKLVGKILRNIIVFIYIFYFFILASVETRIYCEVIKINFLDRTPVLILFLLMCATVYYLISKGLMSIARTCELYGIVVILSIFIIHMLMFTEGKSINIKPVFVLSDFPKYIKAIPEVFPSFLGYEILVIVPFSKKNDKNVIKYTLMIELIIGLLYTIIVESVIALIGVNEAIYYSDVVLTAIRRMRLQYLEFFSRLDALFFVTWTLEVFTVITLFQYGCTFLLSKTFKCKSMNVVALIVILMSLTFAFLPVQLSDVQKLFSNISYLGLLTSFVIPLILYLITIIKQTKFKKP